MDCICQTESRKGSKSYKLLEQFLVSLCIGQDPGAREDTIPLLDHQHFFLRTDGEKNKIGETDGHSLVLSVLAIQLVKADQHLPFGFPSLWEGLWCPTEWFAKTNIKFGKSKQEKPTQQSLGRTRWCSRHPSVPRKASGGKFCYYSWHSHGENSFASLQGKQIATPILLTRISLGRQASHFHERSEPTLQ